MSGIYRPSGARILVRWHVPTEEQLYDVAFYSDNTPTKILARIARSGYRMSFSERLRELRTRSTKAYYAFNGACKHPIGHTAHTYFLNMLEKEAVFAERTMAEAKAKAKAKEQAWWCENDRLALRH